MAKKRKKKESVYATPAEIGKAYEEAIKEEFEIYQKDMADPELNRRADENYEKMKACKDMDELYAVWDSIGKENK